MFCAGVAAVMPTWPVGLISADAASRNAARDSCDGAGLIWCGGEPAVELGQRELGGGCEPLWPGGAGCVGGDAPRRARSQETAQRWLVGAAESVAVELADLGTQLVGEGHADIACRCVSVDELGVDGIAGWVGRAGFAECPLGCRVAPDEPDQVGGAFVPVAAAAAGDLGPRPEPVNSAASRSRFARVSESASAGVRWRLARVTVTA